MASDRVSILLPVLNEADFIDDCLASLEKQDYPGELEVIVVDGGSDDGTRVITAGWQRRLPLMKVIDNPMKVQSHGLNLAAARAAGRFLVRADAHTTYASDYVRRSVERLVETGATVVGGLQVASGTGDFGKAVAEAMSSSLAVGPGAHRHATTTTEADTVYLGAVRKSDWETLGGWRTLPSHVAEDADLHYRWRRQGARILVDPSINSVYKPRETPGSLWAQFYRYGMGKADMLYVNARLPSLRPAAPLALILAAMITVVVGLVWSWWPAVTLIAVWVAALVVAATGRPRVMLAAAIMHVAYGLGMVRGLLRWPPSVRARVE